jgi:hypothetical protein
MLDLDDAICTYTSIAMRPSSSSQLPAVQVIPMNKTPYAEEK